MKRVLKIGVIFALTISILISPICWISASTNDQGPDFNMYEITSDDKNWSREIYPGRDDADAKMLWILGYTNENNSNSFYLSLYREDGSLYDIIRMVSKKKSECWILVPLNEYDDEKFTIKVRYDGLVYKPGAKNGYTVIIGYSDTEENHGTEIQGWKSRIGSLEIPIILTVEEASKNIKIGSKKQSFYQHCQNAVNEWNNKYGGELFRFGQGGIPIRYIRKGDQGYTTDSAGVFDWDAKNLHIYEPKITEVVNMDYTIMHELGHVLGLLDLYISNKTFKYDKITIKNSDKLMYYLQATGAGNKISEEEIAAVRLLTANGERNKEENTDQYEPNNDIQNATGLPNNVIINDALIESETDVDYYKVELSPQSKVNVSMAAPSDRDYELEIINSNSTIVGSSYNSVGYTESIITTLSRGTYYIKVYGYGGAYSEDDYYTLNISASPVASIEPVVPSTPHVEPSIEPEVPQPGIPSLGSPQNGYSMQVGQTVSLQWSDTGASKYRLEVINDSGTGTYGVDVYGTSSTFQPSASGSWRWQVRSYVNNTQVGDAPTARNITVNAIVVQPPNKPNLVSPSNGSSYQGQAPTLYWGPMSSPSGGQIKYYAETFDCPNPQNSDWITGTSWTPSSTTAGLYNWRVKSFDVNTGKESGWGSVWQFTIGSTETTTSQYITNYQVEVSADQTRVWFTPSQNSSYNFKFIGDYNSNYWSLYDSKNLCIDDSLWRSDSSFIPPVLQIGSTYCLILIGNYYSTSDVNIEFSLPVQIIP